MLISAPFRDDLLWQRRDEKQVFELLRCLSFDPLGPVNHCRLEGTVLCGPPATVERCAGKL
jgi:hypothetical protein